MQAAPDYLVYESAHRGNILPLTSVCNVSCVFCSHQQNPPDIQTYKTGHRNLQQIEDTLQFITAEKKIVIGESVTKVIEGEPFTHPMIKEILSVIRNRYPHTDIQITTNGTLIDSKMAKFLAELGRVEINLSLNSADPAVRKRLMNDEKAGIAVRTPDCLAKTGVPYHGSVVAMPHVSGWSDLRETIIYLSTAGARTIRVFLPGFTRLAPEHLRFRPDLREALSSFISSLEEEVSTPITIEPPIIGDIRARVKGVIKNSPAYNAGLIRNDIVDSVNGQKCVSRVDAFHRVREGGPVCLDVLRNNQVFSITVPKEPCQPSGLVMDYDIDPLQIKDVQRLSGKYKKVSLMCSVLGAPILKMAVQAVDIEHKIEIIPVANRYFGGSIMSAGLLMVSDFLQVLKEVSYCQDTEAVLLPAVAFDREGRDLAGKSYVKIQEVAGLPVEII